MFYLKYVIKIIMVLFIFFNCSALLAAELDLNKDNQTKIRGLVRAVNQAAISAELDAQITQIPESVGIKFKEGDVLIKFNCIKQLQEEKAAKAWADIQQQKVKSNKVLQEYESVGAFEILTAMSELSKAEAELGAIQARNKGCVIPAPFTGYVIEKKVNRFEAVSVSQPLIEIVDLSDMNVEIIVPSSWLNWLRINDEFKFSIDETGNVIDAKVIFIRPYIDAVSKTVKVVGKVSKEDIDSQLILPGMSGTVNFKHQGAKP